MNLLPAVVGIGIAIVLNMRGWWLDDAAGVRNVLLALAIAALVIGFLGDPKRTIQREITLWVFVVGMSGVLFAMGPGTIFPIVIAIGSFLATPAILVGAAPALLRRRR